MSMKIYKQYNKKVKKYNNKACQFMDEFELLIGEDWKDFDIAETAKDKAKKKESTDLLYPPDNGPDITPCPLEAGQKVNNKSTK